MAKALKVRSRSGRLIAGLLLTGAVVGLVVLLQSAREQQSWPSAEGTVVERYKSKSAQVKVSYPLPDGSVRTTTLAENGPIREPGSRVTVRYELRDGQVVDAALADNDEGFWVGGVMLGVLIVGVAGMNFAAWRPARTPE